jgi:hypothetical protein
LYGTTLPTASLNLAIWAREETMARFGHHGLHAQVDLAERGGVGATRTPHHWRVENPAQPPHVIERPTTLEVARTGHRCARTAMAGVSDAVLAADP